MEFVLTYNSYLPYINAAYKIHIWISYIVYYVSLTDERCSLFSLLLFHSDHFTTVHIYFTLEPIRNKSNIVNYCNPRRSRYWQYWTFYITNNTQYTVHSYLRYFTFIFNSFWTKLNSFQLFNRPLRVLSLLHWIIETIGLYHWIIFLLIALWYVYLCNDYGDQVVLHYMSFLHQPMCSTLSPYSISTIMSKL